MIEKLKSRKFQVWIMWTILITLNYIFEFNLSDEMIKGYTIISALYIGGESLVDSVKK